MDDTEIVERVRRGDRDAFRLLVERYQATVFAILANLLPGSHDREDIAQEAFLAAYDRLAAFDPARGSFRAWLVTIARNRARNERKRRRPVPHPAVEERRARVEASDEVSDRLDQALAALPDPLRDAFILAEIHELGVPLRGSLLEFLMKYSIA